MAYRGTEQLLVPARPVSQTQDGDPIYADDNPDPRVIRFCQLVPRTLPDDSTKILDGWTVYVPIGQVPPTAKDTVIIRGVEWQIDGNVAPYDKKGVPKGAFFNVEKVI